MRVQYLVGGLMLAATLFSVGCGVDEELTSPMESVEESEATVWCTNKSWLINFYAEPEMINIVGWMRCLKNVCPLRSRKNFRHSEFRVTGKGRDRTRSGSSGCSVYL